MSLLALPALWSGSDPLATVGLLASALDELLPIELCYVCGGELPGGGQLAELRLRRETIAASDGDWRPHTEAWIAERPSSMVVSIEDTPAGPLRIARIAMGYADASLVVVGSTRPDFPSSTDAVLLRAAASLAAAGLRTARLVQERIEADRAKDEFLAMLAHELRNPLAPLTNALRLLRRSATLTEVHETSLAMAERQTRQLTRLVDDLLEVSRITRGKIELRVEPMSVQTAVYNAIDSVSVQAEQRRQQIRVELPATPARILADPARIAQVLENLLNNASKYTPEGGSICVEVDDRPREIEIRVIDDGIGIEPHKIARLFELFTQIDTTIDRTQGGLGIGLALVKRLVELHGGSVAATSDGLGKGACFSVRLPRVDGPTGAATGRTDG